MEISEIARINNPKTFKYDVFVKSGSQNKPHFHFVDKIILIPTSTEWETEKLKISKDCSWDKELVKWLDESYHLIPTITNIAFIRIQWNILNSTNQIEL